MMTSAEARQARSIESERTGIATEQTRKWTTAKEKQLDKQRQTKQ
jgi:hypothetical protein